MQQGVIPTPCDAANAGGGAGKALVEKELMETLESALSAQRALSGVSQLARVSQQYRVTHAPVNAQLQQAHQLTTNINARFGLFPSAQPQLWAGDAHNVPMFVQQGVLPPTQGAFSSSAGSLRYAPSAAPSAASSSMAPPPPQEPTLSAASASLLMCAEAAANAASAHAPAPAPACCADAVEPAEAAPASCGYTSCDGCGYNSCATDPQE